MFPASCRLNHNDNIFVVMDCVLGTPVCNQFLWEIDCVFDAKHFQKIGESLKHGRISRSLVRTRLGRDHWVQDENAGHLSIARPDEYVRSGADQWAQEMLRETPVNVHGGKSWIFAAAPTAADTTVVLFVCSHAVGDGSAMILALQEACAGTPKPLPATRPASLLDNLRDQGTLLQQMMGATRELLRGGKVDAGADTAAGAEPDAAEGAEAAEEATTAGAAAQADVPRSEGSRQLVAVTFAVDYAEFEQRARQSAGTANSLFAAVVGRVAQRLGTLPSTTGVQPLAVPMSKRKSPAELQSNLTQGATAQLDLSTSIYADLSGVRGQMKQAYAKAAGKPGAADLLFEVAQGLPDWLVKRLNKADSAPRTLASNLGKVPADIACLGLDELTEGPAPKSFLSARTTLVENAPALTAADPASTNAWACVVGDSLVVSLVAPEPLTTQEDPHSTEELTVAGAFQAELAAWGLQGKRIYSAPNSVDS